MPPSRVYATREEAERIAKEKRREWKKRYRLEHPEELRQYNRKYREANREKEALRKRIWYQKVKEEGGTVKSRTKAISRFVQWCIDNGHLEVEPLLERWLRS